MTPGSKQAKKDFYAAKKELEQLAAELPNFEALLADNHAEEAKAKVTRNYHELALAKTRVQAARELLEQHHSDIKTAQAEADRLEADYRRETTLDELAGYAKEATRQKEAFEAAMHEANQALKPLVEKLYAARRGLTQAQSDFRKAGRSLNNGFGVTSWPYSMTGEQMRDEETKMHALLAEVQARGVDTDVALTPYDGRRVSVAGLNPQDLALPEPYGNPLWRALSLLEEALLMERRQALEAQDAELPADVVTVR